jgi:hypothetical protein
MKNSLRCLTALATLCAMRALVAAQAAAVAQDTSSVARTVSETTAAVSNPGDAISVGDRLLREAAARLERRASVTARLRHQTSIHGQVLYGVGNYWQQGAGDNLRVRLALQIGREAALAQISNGRFLWVDRMLPTGRTVTRVDLRKLRSDPVLAASMFDGIRPGQANWSPAQSDVAAQIGGLPRLLASFKDNFSFFPPQAMRLVAAGDSNSAGQPFFAVVGRWRSAKLAQLIERQGSTGGGAEAGEALSVPDRLPHEVLLLFGQADLFPYRVEYRRLEVPHGSKLETVPPAYQLSNRPMSVLEFSDVTFDVAIAPSQFDYTPPDVDWLDQTAAVIEKLRRERQQDVAARAGQEAQATPVR